MSKTIIYDKLFKLMNEKGIKKVYLRNNGLNPKTVDSLTKNKSVTIDTINVLCHLLDCQPGDLMEYVPDNPDSEGEFPK